MIPIVIGTLKTAAYGFERRLKELDIGGRIKTIQTTKLLRSDQILKLILETIEDILLLRLQGTISSYLWCEKHSNKIIIVMVLTIKTIIIKFENVKP